MIRGFLSLNDGEARAAFLHTLRAVIEPGGQRVNGSDRLYLAASLPTLLVWGERDPVIPVAHGRAAHVAMPGSWLEVFPLSGHFPHMDDPVRFIEVVHRFLADTEPATLDAETLRERIRLGAPLAA
jgi:pimeloyl-ACP methyl ester carboxylesterase